MIRIATTIALLAVLGVSPRAGANPTAEERGAAVLRRASLATYHRSMGITTWISLAATSLIGTLRYANVIGFGEPLCAEGGSPLFGREFGCGGGHRTWHLISASFTTLSYATTRILAALMPDTGAPEPVRLRLHRALSWVHLAGMIAMPVLGLATATTDDPDTRDALGTAHLLVGYGTLAAVSTAASLMAF